MIKSVEMINWRAYEQRQIIFKPGLNFLMGANGVGKTSVLEAIAYALTGEPSTVNDRAKLLRDPNKDATVRLIFMAGEQEYLVERSQSSKKAEGARLNLIGDRKALASSQSRVTAKIEELLGVSADFLQRIIYMAEGDVFRFLDQPPGEAIDAQIRQVLGLTQMDEFLKATEGAEKELKTQIKNVQELLADLEKQNIRDADRFDSVLRTLSQRRDIVLAQLREAQRNADEFRHNQESILRLKPMLSQATQALKQSPDLWNESESLSAIEIFQQLEKSQQRVSATAQEGSVTQARLQGEQAASQRILDLLLPVADRSETLPCPVCGKPMTKSERVAIIQTIEADISKLDNEIDLSKQQQQAATQALAQITASLTGVRELRNFLVHAGGVSVNISLPLRQLAEEVGRSEDEFRNELAQLEQRLETTNKALAELETERSGVLALQTRLRDMDYASPESASEALVGLETRALTIRAAKNAAEETLSVQRNIDLHSVYEQVAQVWATFLGEERWQVELDKEGMPVMKDRSGREYDLSQFSGGEKTALLIMLHTIIAHHFSKVGFLLVDEPLEHLDAINRRSLVHFLVNAYKHSAFKQAIVATFEETLIRKYMSTEGVQVIHI